MSSNTKKALMMVLGVIVALWAVNFVFHLAVGILVSLLPLALIAGVVYVAYRAFGRKALGGGRRTLP